MGTPIDKIGVRLITTQTDATSKPGGAKFSLGTQGASPLRDRLSAIEAQIIAADDKITWMGWCMGLTAEPENRRQKENQYAPRFR
jgi:hypothetical protein